MLSPTANHRVLADCPGFAGSRRDFVRAVRALAGSVAGGGRLGNNGPWAFGGGLLSCPREDWLRALGREERLTAHYDGSGRMVLQTWQYDCSDGVVLCVGSQHGPPTGNARITLDALYFL